MIQIQTSDNHKHWKGCGTKCKYTYQLLMGIENVRTQLKDSVTVSYKIKSTLTIKSSKYTPGHFPKELKSSMYKKELHMKCMNATLCSYLLQFECPYSVYYNKKKA